MPERTIDLDRYSERVQYQGPLVPTETVLAELHRAQALHIPFENLDIFLGRPIRLDAASLAAKLVGERRGGYCYELNGLFSLVLQQLGFSVTTLAARVINNGVVLQKSHQLMLVETGKTRWLADVGFGGNGLVDPLPFELDREFPQALDTYCITTDPKLGYLFQHKLQDEWRTLYAFTLEEYNAADYRMMNHYNSTSPDSTFTKRRMCIQTTPEMCAILTDFELKLRGPHETTTSQLQGEESYRAALQRYFGIALPPHLILRNPFPPPA